jgi:hypothetical protein
MSNLVEIRDLNIHFTGERSVHAVPVGQDRIRRVHPGGTG